MNESIVQQIHQMRENGLEKEAIFKSLKCDHMVQHDDLEKLIDEFIFRLNRCFRELGEQSLQ